MSEAKDRRVFSLLPLLLLLLAVPLVTAGWALARPAAGTPFDLASRGNAPAQGTPTASATPACPSGWTTYPNPAPPGESTLHAVTSFSPTDLWAVGEYGSSPQHTLIVHGNGTDWTTVPSPSPVTTTVVSLLGVGGVAANDVWAVGTYNYHYTLIEHWDGSSWSIVPSPSIHGYDRLNAVTAIASNDVWAVGTYDFGPTTALTEHWDGRNWTIVPGPSCLCDNYYIDAVAAVASNDVWAMGTRIMHWDGSSWSFVPNPDVGGDNFNLYAVAAVAANNIWAVGWHQPHSPPYPLLTLVLHWDGTAWTVVPSPSPGATTNELYNLSVRANNDIWAVGDTNQAGGGTKVLAEHWDGSAWTAVPTPDNPTGGDHFYGVVAPGGGPEWAVGSSGCTSGCSQDALIMRYGPQCTTPTPTPQPCGLAWRTLLSPSPGVRSGLYSVAVVAANDIWAAGFDSDGRLIEHWDGSSWTVVPGPNVPSPHVPEEARYMGLYGMSAVAANDIWTVGYGAIIEHWDGTQWSIVPSPGGSTLNGVAALAANNVWAVGSADTGLIEHWNGTQWSIVPNPSPAGSVLNGVAVVSANDIWAVGEQYPQGGPWQMLSEHWDGTKWSEVSIPTPGAAYNQLRGVAAVASNDVWAVGDYNDCWGCPELTVIEHWNGTQWSIVPSPNPGASYSELWGVTVAGGASNDVWAVGDSSGCSGCPEVTATEHWDGSSWSVVPGSPFGVMYAVAPVASSDVWAVGTRPGTSDDITLSEHYNDPCGGGSATPTGTSTSTPTHTPTAIVTAIRTATAMPPTLTSTRTVPSSTVTEVHTVASPTPQFTATSTPTPVPYQTTVPSSTIQATPTTRTGSPTPTACSIQFSDVPQDSTFYPYIRCLACRGIVSGYSDSTFRPGNSITRGQISKIVCGASQRCTNLPAPTGQTFEDVPPSHTFYMWIEKLVSAGAMGGYPCGTNQYEACVPPLNRPYFRPFANATRGQISKIVATADGYNGQDPGQQIYEDVPPGNAFYMWIQYLSNLGVMSGYECGSNPNEGCVPPQNRPYFRPNNAVTRGQASKIVANTFSPNCQTPARK